MTGGLSPPGNTADVMINALGLSPMPTPGGCGRAE